MDNWIWMAAGAGIVVTARLLQWLYWRFFGRGSLHDYIRQEEAPEGEYRVLRKIKTPTQRIAHVEVNGETWIYSNGDVMFTTSEDENQYAEALVHIPMAAAVSRERVLIIGGGGGITTREALRYADVGRITTVDIDEAMMNFGKQVDSIIAFNDNALNHPKVTTVIDDGREFIERSTDKWNVIIIDIPEPNGQRPNLSRLFSDSYYALLHERLAPGGAISVACSASSYMPEYYWSIQATLEQAGFHVIPYHYDYIVESGEDWGFCLATASPLDPKQIKLPVQTRYLTDRRLADMFHIPHYFANHEQERAVQTDNNRVLLDIVMRTYGV